jgi:hypothetical protein
MIESIIYQQPACLFFSAPLPPLFLYLGGHPGGRSLSEYLAFAWFIYLLVSELDSHICTYLCNKYNISMNMCFQKSLPLYQLPPTTDERMLDCSLREA